MTDCSLKKNTRHPEAAKKKCSVCWCQRRNSFDKILNPENNSEAKIIKLTQESKMGRKASFSRGQKRFY